MKKALYILGGLALVLVIAFLVLSFSLGSIVKGGVNRMGPQMTQSNVVLGGAQISPFTGQGTLSNLTVGNPSGWQTPQAFSLGEIHIEVEPTSLLGDHIIVKSLVIDQPEITYETRLSTSNLQELLQNIQASVGTSEPPREGTSKPIKLEIHHFALRQGKLTARAGEAVATVELPELTMTDLGVKEGGLTPPQLAVAVMREVTAQAARAGARAALEKGVVEKGLQKLLGGQK